MSPQTNSSQWSATYGADKLTVSGHYTFPTTGYTVNLKKKEPQGTNHGILLLQQTVTPPTGIVADHVVNEVVTFEERTESRYSEVEILPEGIKIAVKAA